jgi:hypothetical protein
MGWRWWSDIFVSDTPLVWTRLVDKQISARQSKNCWLCWFHLDHNAETRPNFRIVDLKHLKTEVQTPLGIIVLLTSKNK